MNRIRRWVKNYTYRHGIYRLDRDLRKKLLRSRFSRDRKILLLGTPIHGNLGDHLIAAAEEDYFKKYFPELTYVEFPMLYTMYHPAGIRGCVHKGDIICLSGGGWLGTEWRHNEDFVRRVIESFPDNPIVILPQTVYYEGDDAYMRDGAAVYSAHKHLLVCLRDQASYDFMISSGFVPEDRAYLMPDMALLYRGGFTKRDRRRDAIGLCLRDDIEKELPEPLVEEIREAARNIAPVKEIRTNISPRMVPVDARRAAIDRKLSEIGELKLLVTDRLHAMVFAAIAGTPCLAFDNRTHKVTGVYKWIEGTAGIRLGCKKGSAADQIKEMSGIETEEGLDRDAFVEYELGLQKKIASLAGLD